jgi:signal transduction histidine kinase
VFYLDADVQDGKPEQALRDAVRSGVVHELGWRRRKDGSQYWANATITALVDDYGGLRGFVKLTRDETLRREAGLLAERLVQLAERDRIGQVLTDSIVHRLFGIGLQLQSVLTMVTEPEALQRIEIVIAEADTAINDIRATVLNLTPDG